MAALRSLFAGVVAAGLRAETGALPCAMKPGLEQTRRRDRPGFGRAFRTSDPLAGAGMTRVEVMVAIAVIAILAGMLLPALARAKAKATGILCMNNQKQLMLAEHMFQSDRNDKFPGPYRAGFVPGSEATEAPWARGWLDWTTSPDNTNTVFLLDPRSSPLSAYFAQAKNIFRCPADNYVSPAQRAKGWTGRARSISRSALFADAHDEDGPLGSIYASPVQASGLSIAGPTETLLWLDEHPDSINDWVFVPPNNSMNFVDVPSTCHNGAGGFGFMDGHSEIHRWTGPTLRGPLRKVTYRVRHNVPTVPDDPDLRWLSYRSPRQTTDTY